MEKVLIGGGGHSREVMAQMGVKLDRFVDDQYVKHSEDVLPLSLFDPKKHIAMIAVADSRDRYDITQRLPKDTQFFTFIHPTALLIGDVKIGEGSFIGAYSILTTNINIGEHAILNRGNQIGHDCIIGNYFSAMPNAVVGGNVEIGDRVYMGSCSNIKEKIQITSDCVIGMNGAVVNNILESGTYVGVPCKKKIINKKIYGKRNLQSNRRL
jgi:sugar O-acyltransferase (sialic acid O-acetyltransferase NeuD family)